MAHIFESLPEGLLWFEAQVHAFGTVYAAVLKGGEYQNHIALLCYFDDVKGYMVPILPPSDLEDLVQSDHFLQTCARSDPTLDFRDLVIANEDQIIGYLKSIRRWPR